MSGGNAGGGARCGARTRAGAGVRARQASGKRRCRMHGGARGSGGQPGNRNAWKHGGYSAEALAERRYFRELLAVSLRTLAEAEEEDARLAGGAAAETREAGRRGRVR